MLNQGANIESKETTQENSTAEAANLNTETAKPAKKATEKKTKEKKAKTKNANAE
jgi:hypothetical protein